jgi:hypothetical protein
MLVADLIKHLQNEYQSHDELYVLMCNRESAEDMSRESVSPEQWHEVIKRVTENESALLMEFKDVLCKALDQTLDRDGSDD